MQKFLFEKRRFPDYFKLKLGEEENSKNEIRF